MNNENYKAITEGLLFASGDDGVTAKQLAQTLEISEDNVFCILEELKQDYESPVRGIKLMQSHNRYHLTTKPEHSVCLKRLIETPQSNRLSQAALETLAVIAYQQPITKAEIEEIRGVKSDRPVQTLLNRMLIEEIGRKEGIGRPILFATSKDFLTFFGLTSLEELPPLPDVTNTEEEDADLFFDEFSDYFNQSNN